MLKAGMNPSYGANARRGLRVVSVTNSRSRTRKQEVLFPYNGSIAHGFVVKNEPLTVAPRRSPHTHIQIDPDKVFTVQAGKPRENMVELRDKKCPVEPMTSERYIEVRDVKGIPDGWYKFGWQLEAEKVSGLYQKLTVPEGKACISLEFLDDGGVFAKTRRPGEEYHSGFTGWDAIFDHRKFEVSEARLYDKVDGAGGLQVGQQYTYSQNPTTSSKITNIYVRDGVVLLELENYSWHYRNLPKT